MLSDLKLALRQMRKHPGFTAVAVLTLALGIGANTAMFSIVNSVLLKPLPYDEPGQLVQVWEAPGPGQRNWASPGAFLDWKEHSTVFENLSLLDGRELNLTGEGKPERISGVGMSAAGLTILRVRPLLGRIFAPDEDQPGKDQVIVLSHGFWQRRFGGDPSVVGRTIQLDHQSHTVIGVLAPTALPWGPTEFVVPMAILPSAKDERGSHWLQVFGRLKPGETLERAGAEMSAVAAQLRPLYPAWKQGWGVTLVPLHEQLTGETRPTLLILFGAVGCVLLIACSNVANLLLAKSSGRQKEMALRTALGAGRWRIVRQLLTESMLLSLAGASLGLLLAFWGVGAIKHLNAANLPRTGELSLDLRVLGFAVMVSLFSGVVFGLVPALQSARVNLNDMLKEGARSSGSGPQNRVRNGLIVAEVALSLVLLVGAGLLLNSFVRLSHVPPGIDPRNVLAMQVTLPEKRYPDAARRTDFFERTLDRIQALPGVVSAGVVGKRPVNGGSMDTTFSIAGRSDAPPAGHGVDFDFCTPDYFRAVGIPLLKGRAFTWEDRAGSPRVILVNEALARRHFPAQDPIGQLIHLDVATGRIDEGWEIIGVVGDVRQHGLGREARPCVYRPQAFSFLAHGNLLVRTTGAPLAMAEAVREAVLEIDSNQPVANIRTMEDAIASSLAQERFVLVLLAGFSGVALLLAAIGLYGVIAYAVTQRTRELGIRMALGANRRDVLALIVGQGMRLATVGLVVGLVGSIGLTRVLTRMLYEVKPTDPTTFAGVSMVLLGVALFACWLPARRASRSDPMVALRSE
ncbi:MAG: ABC transporter permease [Verrucomicrobiales bacterium]|nr:ABC transporter permease [Verrucomicrobiales bacterium]